MFPTTMWSVVLGARDRRSTNFRRNLDRLTRLYWRPVYVYLRGAGALSPEDAQDLVQSFFARFLDRDVMAAVAPERGRFRSFLRAAARHFLLNYKRDGRASKRVVPIDAVPEPPAGLTPDELFEREWVRCLMREAEASVERTLRAEGKVACWEAFRRHRDHPKETYADIARAIGTKESDVRNHLHATRKLFRDAVRAQVAQVVDDPSQIDDEIAHILSISW